MNYLLLINYGVEGWAVKAYKTEQELLKDVAMGETHGNEFKIAKEIKIKLEDHL